MTMSTDPTTTSPPAATAGKEGGKKKPMLKPELRRVQIDPSALRTRTLPGSALERRKVPIAGAGPDRPMKLPPKGALVGAPSAEGVFQLDQDGVKAAIDSRMEDIEGCYDTALFHTPGLSGKMTLVMDVQPVDGQEYGSVEGVDAESNLDATVFEGCVATVFEELKFAITEPTKLRYPIEFDADDEAPAEP